MDTRSNTRQHLQRDALRTNPESVGQNAVLTDKNKCSARWISHDVEGGGAHHFHLAHADAEQDGGPPAPTKASVPLHTSKHKRTKGNRKATAAALLARAQCPCLGKEERSGRPKITERAKALTDEECGPDGSTPENVCYSSVLDSWVIGRKPNMAMRSVERGCGLMLSGRTDYGSRRHSLIW